MSLDPALAATELAAGNHAYRAGDYGASILRYEAALEAGADGADLWFNLGNAYYRAGEQGRAVLAFERALRRDPGDEGARTNLELILSQAEGAVVVQEPFLARLGGRIDPDLAAGLLALCWGLACLAWAVRRVLASGPRRVAATVALAVLLAGSLAGAAATWSSWQVRHDGWAVVVGSGTVRRAPAPEAAPLFEVGEGSKLRLLRSLGDFVQVRSGERDGWIERERVEAIDGGAEQLRRSAPATKAVAPGGLRE